MRGVRAGKPGLVLALALVLVSLVQAADTEKSLLDLSSGAEQNWSPQHGADAQVQARVSPDPAAPGLLLSVQPGKSAYPGIVLKPAGSKFWDLSACGHIEARVVNTGATTGSLSLRVDNEGDWHASPWNCEAITLKPQEAGTVRVIFGYQYGHQPGYALKTKEVAGLVLFSDKVDAPRSFRIESIVAGGPAGEKPAMAPAAVRTRPARGVLLGPGVTLDLKSQVEKQGVQSVSLDHAGLRVMLPPGKGGQSVSVKPAVGRWDLCETTELRVRVKNEGPAAVLPGVQVFGKAGPILANARKPLAAGQEQELVVSFLADTPGRGVPVPRPGHYGNQRGSGTNFTSEAVSAVTVSASHDGQATLVIRSITATATPVPLPEWAGKRPPVDGDWGQTFDEEFDRPAIDARKWNIYGPNWWDRYSHWSKDNLILKDGVAVFHFEKKRGFHNDNADPKVIPENLTRQKESDYACGYLDTLGKFRQRYGYFEARVKLPRAAGLWPTFWMMPDRGPGTAPGKQRSTSNGGMEFDIMEHLTRWGPYRYNIALHFDDYGKEHKSVGSTCNYVAPAADGFITAGLLWLPGSATFYGNGRELWRWEDPRVANVPGYFIIEITTGGWDNDPVDDRQLPADYLIDYVRAWQRKDLATSADLAPAGK